MTNLQVRMLWRLLFGFFVTLVLSSAHTPAAFGQSIVCDGALWTGGAENQLWNDSANWSTGSVPNSPTQDVCINTTFENPVNLNISATVADLSLFAGTSLQALGTNLTVDGSTLSNFGTITVGNVGTLIVGSSSLTLNGGGTLILGASTGAGRISESVSNAVLTNVDNTIEGVGAIGFGLSLVNGGTVNANVTGQTLDIGGTGTLTNYTSTHAGTLEATLGGTLELSSLTVINGNGATASGGSSGSSGGSIIANTGTVLLPGADIQGGTLVIANAGVMGTPGEGSTTLDGSTAAGPVTIQGLYTIFNATTTNVLGTLIIDGTNNGAIQINGGSQFGATLAISDNVTLKGGGIINLSNVNSGPALIGANSTGLTLTNVNVTIQGAGFIGNNGMTLINGGTINANIAPSAPTMSSAGSLGFLVLQANTTNSYLGTPGLLEGTNGGQLQIASVVNNFGALVLGNGGSVELINGGTIQGGTITTMNDGEVGSSGFEVTGTLDGITQGVLTISTDSTYTVNNGSRTILLGTIFNAGTIQIIGGADNGGTLGIGNPTNAFVTLDGGGTVLMSTATGGGQALITETNTSQTLINANDTIEGAGMIGNGLTLENGGTVNADTTAGTGTLVMNGPIVNSNGDDGGTLEASDGGVLQIQATVDNANGTILADGGTVRLLTGTVIQGGTLTSMNSETNTGEILNIGSITLDGSTDAGQIDITDGTLYTTNTSTNTIIVGTITMPARCRSSAERVNSAA